MIYLGAATALRADMGSQLTAGSWRHWTTSPLSQLWAESPLQQLFLAWAHAARPNASGKETSPAKLMNEPVAHLPPTECKRSAAVRSVSAPAKLHANAGDQRLGPGDRLQNREDVVRYASMYF